MRRGAIALVILAVAVTPVIGCGSDDDTRTDIATASSIKTSDESEPPTTSTPPSVAPTTTAPTTTVAAGISLSFRGGEVEGGVKDEAVALGDPVRLVVTSDVDEEIHVHGYDLEVAVPAGSTQTIEFDANLPGVWEVELHESGLQVLQLQVQG